VRLQGEYFEGDLGTIVLCLLLSLILIGWILLGQTTYIKLNMLRATHRLSSEV
jgi:hypothetical protein